MRAFFHSPGVDAPGPPRLAAVLHVGVRGEPEPGVRDTASLGAAIRSLLGEIARAAAQAAAGAADLFAAGPPVLRCVSPLGCETDRIVAREALALGFRLQVPLPAPPERLGARFPDEDARSEFEGLLEAAEVVVALDGDAWPSGSVEKAVDGIVLDQSDLLLVFDDGRAGYAADEPGTLLGEARARNIPVVAAGSSPPHTVRIVGPADAGDWRDGLSMAVRNSLDPFGTADPSEQAASRAALRLYLGERARPARWYSGLHGLFEKAVLIGWRAPPRKAGPVGTDAFAQSDASAREFAWADTLAIHYASLYRSAFVLRYLLIFPAAFGIIVGFFAETPAVRATGFAVQWLSVVGTLALTWLGRRTDWHERFTSYRLLAELLRHQNYLGRFGRVVRTALYPAHRKTETSVWVVWRFRTVVRQDGLLAMGPRPMDGRQMACALGAFLEGQAGFYRRSAARYAAIGNRLSGFGVSLFWVDFVVITLRGWAIGYLRTAGLPSISGFAEALDWTENTLNELDILLPSIAWIVLALGDQGEYYRLSGQYETMTAQAEHLAAELDHAEPSYLNLVRIAVEAATSLTSEVADWRLLISARAVSYI